MMEEADSAADPEIPIEDYWAVFSLRPPAGASMLSDNTLNSTHLV